MNRETILRELNQSDGVLTTVLNSIFDGVYIVDPQRRIIFWNRAAEEITGHLAKDVMGRCCHDTILNHIDENGTMLCFSACPLARSIRTGESLEAKVYPKHRDGHRFCEVITRECHGDIDKFIGDAIMAVFIDANDAVAAGRKVLSAVARLNQTRQARTLEGIQIRIGINSGSVIQGEIGTSSRKDVTVIGDVVNTAARIESNTEPMRMGISEATYARLREPGRFNQSKKIQVKNRKAPVTIYVAGSDGP